MKKKYAKPGFNRKRRLAAAKHWRTQFKGKNIVRGYRKTFGVDWPCAIDELKMLEQELMMEAEKLEQMTDIEEYLAFLAAQEK